MKNIDYELSFYRVYSVTTFMYSYMLIIYHNCDPALYYLITKGISLAGKIVIGVSVGLISTVAFTIMLLVLCGFKFCKHSSGE